MTRTLFFLWVDMEAFLLIFKQTSPTIEEKNKRGKENENLYGNDSIFPMIFSFVLYFVFRNHKNNFSYTLGLSSALQGFQVIYELINKTFFMLI